MYHLYLIVPFTKITHPSILACVEELEDLGINVTIRTEERDSVRVSLDEIPRADQDVVMMVLSKHL